MAAILLDVNVLVALLWEGHDDHDAARQWFGENEKKGWATCPFTQAAFVRIVSNPAFSSRAVKLSEAVALLEENTQRSSHEFWRDNISFADAAAYLRPDLTGHKQVTDAYLLGLAIHHRSKLATFDKPLSTLLPASLRKSDWIVELSRRSH
ncbi:MAG TPA: TA system VapC family ribonuclease toxin [Acidobacteriaceae bacterium]|nr:TA system VapC family ribonuclease toxin [Acidobacteriaceae bacterium]